MTDPTTGRIISHGYTVYHKDGKDFVHVSDFRKERARAEAAEAELLEARETNERLHRRVQQAEKTAYRKAGRMERKYQRARQLMSHFVDVASKKHARAEAAEAEVARLREVLVWLDSTIDDHCTPTGKPARIRGEDGEWHSGPAAEICQSVLRALQILARNALGKDMK